MTGKRKTEWFVEPKDEFSNEVIAGEIQKTDTLHEMINLNGHDVYPISNRVRLLLENNKDSRIKFKIFYRNTPTSKIQEWKIYKKKRKSKKFKQVEKKLKEIQKRKKEEV